MMAVLTVNLNQPVLPVLTCSFNRHTFLIFHTSCMLHTPLNDPQNPSSCVFNTFLCLSHNHLSFNECCTLPSVLQHTSYDGYFPLYPARLLLSSPVCTPQYPSNHHIPASFSRAAICGASFRA